MADQTGVKTIGPLIGVVEIMDFMTKALCRTGTTMTQMGEAAIARMATVRISLQAIQGLLMMKSQCVHFLVVKRDQVK